MALCDLCGATLDEDEAEEEFNGRQVCHNCRYDGITLLKEKIGELIKIGRDQLESKRRLELELEEEEDEAGDDGSTDTRSDHEESGA